MSSADPVAGARAALVAGLGQAPDAWAALWAAYWAARGLPAPPAEAPPKWHTWQEPTPQELAEEEAAA